MVIPACRHLLFSDLVHQLIDLIQQEQPPLGILCLGDTSVDAACNLVDVISDMMYFCPQFLDLLRRAGFDFCSLDQAAKVGCLGESTAAGTALQTLLFLLRQPQAYFVFFRYCHLLCGPIRKNAPPAGGIGVRGYPLQARKRYLCAMLAPSPPRGR